MDDNLSQNRLVRNEQVIRNHNVSLENAIVKFAQNDPSVKKAPVSFLCECSVSSCKKKINISIEHYHKIHRRKDYFMVKPGHAIPSLEKTIVKDKELEIVEKLQVHA